MKMPIVAALAALLLLAPVADASAQGRGEGRYRAAERQADRNYDRARAQESRGRQGPPQSRQRPPRSSSRQDYRPSQRDYGPPPRALGRGQVIPQPYRGAQIRDFSRYRLRPPPSGYDWVGVGPDIYLVQRSTGMVLESIPGGGY